MCCGRVFIWVLSTTLAVTLSKAEDGNPVNPSKTDAAPAELSSNALVAVPQQQPSSAGDQNFLEASRGLVPGRGQGGLIGRFFRGISNVISWTANVTKKVVLWPLEIAKNLFGSIIPPECERFLPKTSIVEKILPFISLGLYFVMPFFWLFNPINIVGALVLGPFYNIVLAVVTPARGIIRFLIQTIMMPFSAVIRKLGFVNRSFFLLNFTDFIIAISKLLINFIL